MDHAVALAAFMHAYLGKAGLGDTTKNKGQCVGLVELWLDQQRKPHIWGDAKDLLNNANAQDYRVIRNAPDNYPYPGNVVCWDGTWGAGAGHTALVVAANADRLAVCEQNDPEGVGCLVATHDYSGVQGWLAW